MPSKIVVTGTTGLSESVMLYLMEKGFDAECLSLRNDAWERIPFNTAETVVHIAGVVPKEGVTEKDYYGINTELTKKAAQKAKADGVGHFIYLSSMAVYGAAQKMNADAGTVTEQTACRPDSDYGKSKLAAEKELERLRDDSFSVAVIRVPSIYGKGKTEYIDQYKYLARKLPFIPVCFNNLKKSAISTQNLCELIRLIIQNKSDGVFCPDDGAVSAVEICSAIFPQKRKSSLFGKIMEIFLKNNPRILDYYGAVCYSDRISGCFDGKYRVLSLQEGIDKAYEE